MTLDAGFLGQWSAEHINRDKPPVASPSPSLASPSTSQGTNLNTSLNTRIRNAYRTRVFWLRSGFSKHTSGFGIVLEQKLAPAPGWRPEILWQAFEESSTSIPPYASGSLLGRENQSTQILDLPGAVFSTNAANIKVRLKIGLRHPQLGRRETETADLRLRSLESNLIKTTTLPMTVHLGVDLTKKSSTNSYGDWVGVWNTIPPGKAAKKIMIDSFLLKNEQGLEAVFKQLSLHQDFIVTDSAGSVL